MHTQLEGFLWSCNYRINFEKFYFYADERTISIRSKSEFLAETILQTLLLIFRRIENELRRISFICNEIMRSIFIDMSLFNYFLCQLTE